MGRGQRGGPLGRQAGGWVGAGPEASTMFVHLNK